MYSRLIDLPKDTSFFLFGQRGTGKSTLLKKRFLDGATEDILLLDLLDSRSFRELSNKPWQLKDRVEGKKTVIIDEVQKIPALLDEVHKLIEDEKIIFILTGSSARKLKKTGANLLAGRALKYNLFGLSHLEYQENFDLTKCLDIGSLPGTLDKPQALAEDFLYTYVETYLREEILYERIIRDLEPFNLFLDIAAQGNGDNCNYANIASDVGVSAKSIKGYYDILIDTLLGFRLPSYHKSVRKQHRRSPKFYFYDIGLVRALNNTLGERPAIGSSDYGKLFESFVINEFIKLNEYYRTRFLFSHLRVGHQDEIDLVIEPPNKPAVLVEIKSKVEIRSRDTRTLAKYEDDFRGSKAYLLSQDETSRTVNDVTCLHWKQGIEKIFADHAKQRT